MNVEIDPNSLLPAYEQLRVQIVTMIEAGVLPPGAQLPPIRQLAHDLDLAPGTVARAYRELDAQGLTSARPRRGTVVAAQPTLSSDERRRRLALAAQTYALTARQLGAEPQAAVEEVHRMLHTAQPAGT